MHVDNEFFSRSTFLKNMEVDSFRYWCQTLGYQSLDELNKLLLCDSKDFFIFWEKSDIFHETSLK